MFNVFRERKSQNTLSSSRELRGVQMHVFTKAGGVIGNMIGRDLKMRVDQFEYEYKVEEPSSSSSESRKVLSKVVVASESLVPVAEVDHQKFDRLLLTVNEAEKVARRMRLAVLDSDRHPTITFNVDTETPSHINGRLTLRGEERYVTCTKEDLGAELVVTCPIDYTKHGAPAYGHLLGMLSVQPVVEVVTRVPKSVLTL